VAHERHGTSEAIGSRQVSSQEVIEAHLQRVEAVNGSINAVVIGMAEQALKAAKTADHAVANGADLGPFHGVPFNVKENIDVADTIGRTNLPSGAIRWHCESELWGATVKPWNRSRTSGE
jgi:amidase